MAKRTTKPKKTTVPNPAMTTMPSDPFAHLPTVAGLFQSIQRDRVGMERALATRGTPDPQADAILAELRSLEEHAVDYLTNRCERSSAYTWLRGNKGIGERLAGMLIGLIDIRRADTVSALWRYAGFAVVCGAPAVAGKVTTEMVDAVDDDGQAIKRRQPKLCRLQFGLNGLCPTHGKAPGVSEQRRKGVKLAYNIKLKKTCFLLARSFLLFQTPVYYQEYVRAKEFYIAERPTWPDGRRDLAARRRAIKLFLSHLWTTWRTAEGLPVGEPYAFAKLEGHTKYITPPNHAA